MGGNAGLADPAPRVLCDQADAPVADEDAYLICAIGEASVDLRKAVAEQLQRWAGRTSTIQFGETPTPLTGQKEG